jgi:tyrosine-protein kinase Etk/Wzc
MKTELERSRNWGIGMSEYDSQRDELSMLALGTILVRRRWRIARFLLLGGVIAVGSTLSRPRKFVGSASFVPASSDSRQSGLASLAGQFGVAIPTGNSSVSPEFYASLLESRALLLAIARDTVALPEFNGVRVPLINLLVPSDRPATPSREDEAVRALRGVIGVSTVKATGVVALTVTTRWRNVSVAIADALVRGVNDFNQRTRQGQATAERKFVEGRLALASAELRATEDRLRQFLEGNRNIGNAPELSIQRDRIQRDLTLRQQVFTSLTQSYEEARVREVRETPVITTVDAPSVPADPEPRGLVKALVVGALLGGIFGAVLAVAQEMARRRSKQGDTEANAFLESLQEAKGDLRRAVPWAKHRSIG